MFFVEPLHDVGVGQVRLANEFRGRMHKLLFFPVDSNLRLAYFGSPFKILRTSHNPQPPLLSLTSQRERLLYGRFMR